MGGAIGVGMAIAGRNCDAVDVFSRGDVIGRSVNVTVGGL